MANTLTISDFSALEIVVSSVQGNAKVARVMDNGDVINGIARCIGDENGCSRFGADVRDQFLRVTTEKGWEMFWPVAELMLLARDGLFVQYDW